MTGHKAGGRTNCNNDRGDHLLLEARRRGDEKGTRQAGANPVFLFLLQHIQGLGKSCWPPPSAGMLHLFSSVANNLTPVLPCLSSCLILRILRTHLWKPKSVPRSGWCLDCEGGVFRLCCLHSLLTHPLHRGAGSSSWASQLVKKSPGRQTGRHLVSWMSLTGLSWGRGSQGSLSPPEAVLLGRIEMPSLLFP